MRTSRASLAGRWSGAWAGYAAIALVGSVLYGVGAVGPYLRTALGLSDTEVGLHSTALAAGTIIAGLAAAAVGRRLGEVPVRAMGVGLLAVAVLGLAGAPALGVTLGAALLIGIGIGILLGYTNAALAAAGGVRAQLQLARANVWAMVAAFLVPALLALGATAGPGWWLGLLPAAVLLMVVALDLRNGARLPAPAAPTPGGPGRLPRAYWRAWAFLTASVAAEFAFVVWAATLVERRTGASTAEATLIASLFLLGMLAGRLGLSAGLGTGADVRRSTVAALAVAGIGAVVVWLSGWAALSGVALFVAGLGVAVLYPLGVTAAIATAPDRLVAAGARLNLASGVAVIVSPLALGALSDRVGVVIGWGLVVLLIVVALLLATRLPVAASVVAGNVSATVARQGGTEDGSASR